ncbi:glycosyl hydrolase [Fulvivirga sp. RKSG066]|uniref:glycoside hydrolase family 3 N-terminal domain-containing protein n=1 Tax=Fulvivirga aurantia TaxID=2529383 RepID=UPI0012BCA955|nr:glycoside hydrolase family 3 N-terminal domain-containing protein [Fulvivirga aurantia]MTI22376.1 glycosyl hydrolase [Fulvivirga aurantia]
MIKKVFSAFLLYFLIAGTLNAQSKLQQTEWVDSVYNALNLEEKIGQLFMVAAYSGGNEQHYQVIDQLIKKHKIGGLIFMQGHPHSQARLVNRYQCLSDVPLLIGMDAEWGLGMRLDSTVSFPKQMVLGAIENDTLIYQMGALIAKQLKKVGAHVNFAPVVDINSNPNNPVIGVRSFGENKEQVAQKSVAYMNGLQDNGILAVAKHFPGHGDTDKDSHKTLPYINHSKERLQQTELYPFSQLIEAGVGGVMTGHLLINALDSRNPASLSPKITGDLLHDELNFDGLVFSDALNMKAVAGLYESVEAAAFLAGNDVLLFSQDVPGAIKSLKKLIKKDRDAKRQLAVSVKKVLNAKYKAGLYHKQDLNTDNLTLKLNAPQLEVLKRKLYENAVTLVKNEGQSLPVDILDNKYFASIDLGNTDTFNEYLKKFTFFSQFENISRLSTRELSAYDYVMVGLTKIPDAKTLEMLGVVDQKTTLIISYFGSPYEMMPLENFNNVLCLYDNNEMTQKLAAEAIFGAIPAAGKLPVSISQTLTAGTTNKTNSNQRLAYSIPEAVGMDSKVLNKIDRIVNEAIADQATPGCQVLVAKDGKVVFEKAYGHFTYDSIKRVTPETIYDIASITKVFASMQAFMFLEERGLVDLDKKISLYLPELAGTNKENMTFRDILTHQAGLWPYLPFWKQTLLKDTIYRSDFYLEELTPNYPNQVSTGLYSSNIMQDSVWQWVKQSKLRTKEPNKPYDYKYSDMGYYMVKRLVEKLLNQSMEVFLQQNFYDPMGLSTMSYLPLCKFPLDRIAPTENDNYFRRTLVYGMVHDQGAALLGGVAGHAGLFSNANDMAKMTQMHLNGGTYGNLRYFKESTLDKFTAQQYANNRRGIGWDKPLRGEWYGPTSEYASGKTFGHTGFTGTAVWADPEFDLIYVFLSNRIHPDASNAKLIKNNIRTRIQDIIYESIWEQQQHAENLN